MNSLPGLETERLVLRQRSFDDVEAFIEMDMDPEVSRFLNGPWPEDEHRAKILDRIGQGAPGGLGWWSVFAKNEPGRFLGGILLIPLAYEGPEVEIGWRFRRDGWGKGYAPEAAAPVLHYGFERLGLNRIIAVLDPKNVRSRRVAEKIGMKDDGLRQAYGHEVQSYAIDRTDLPSGA